jgi:hypothetical protein
MLLNACSNESKEVEKVTSSPATEESEETKKDEEEANIEVENVPSDEEVKAIIEKSYNFLSIVQEYFDQNQQGIHEPFLNALKEDFSDKFIASLNPADFGIATSYNFPTSFEYDKHFVIQTRTADTLVVESFQEGMDYEELIYTIEAIKENGEWKINDFDYRTNESTETSSEPGLLTEEEAREIVNNYLSSYKEYDVSSISLHDENTFFIEAYIYASEEHMTAAFLAMDRTTGIIRQVDITDEEFFGN